MNSFFSLNSPHHIVNLLMKKHEIDDFNMHVLKSLKKLLHEVFDEEVLLRPLSRRLVNVELGGGGRLARA